MVAYECRASATILDLLKFWLGSRVTEILNSVAFEGAKNLAQFFGLLKFWLGRVAFYKYEFHIHHEHFRGDIEVLVKRLLRRGLLR